MRYFNINSILKPVLAGFVFFISAGCNKDYQQPSAPPSGNAGPTIWQIIDSGGSYTTLKTAILKAGLDSVLNTAGNSLTLFAPDDNAFALSGITPVTVQGLSAAQLQEILSYHIIPSALPSSLIPAAFPNTEMPTLLQLDPTNPLIKMDIFPWKTSSNQLYANSIPVTVADQAASNGVIHTVAAVVTPPSELLASLIYGDTTLTYLAAAIARADSGQVGLNKVDSLLKYPLINMTILAPNNSAFQNILYEEVYGTLLQEGVPAGTASAEASALSSSPNIFSNPLLYDVLTAATVRGILVYHILAIQASGSYEPLDRVFSVNFPSVPGSFVTTLVNSAYPSHPGIMALAVFSGPIVNDLQFTGLGTFPPGGMPYSGTTAHAVKMDEIGVNGVVHIIDQVLLPQ
ncbi:MAG TPA: fasciclin domain-containing protein [Puia sp.]|nr:fasciclin domain-containing protein [Puia sp.]